MKNSQKWFVVSLLIAALVISGGVYYLSQKSKSLQIPSVAEQQPNVRPVIQTTPSKTLSNNMVVASSTSDITTIPKKLI